MERKSILITLRAQLNINGHIIGASVGSGMTAHSSLVGGADFLLLLSSSKYRNMGRSSYGSFLCYHNNNNTVMEVGCREILPIIGETPLLFGLQANDPGIELEPYLKEIQSRGFSGITNFPTVSLLDGQFREALEESGNSYAREVEAIRLAHKLDLFTVAFVTTEAEALSMLEAGADVICVLHGFSRTLSRFDDGHLSLHESMQMTERIYSSCISKYPDLILTIHAGSANTPLDMQYLYMNTHCQGYIGGSTFDRIPSKKAIESTIHSFKYYGKYDKPTVALQNNWNAQSHSDNIKQYIKDHYMEDIHLQDLSIIAHVNASYLSTRFKKENGVSFTEYLIRFRMNKARELLKNKKTYCKEVGVAVGYPDYAQFSKLFKKYVGMSPTEYQKKYQ